MNLLFLSGTLRGVRSSNDSMYCELISALVILQINIPLSLSLD